MILRVLGLVVLFFVLLIVTHWVLSPVLGILVTLAVTAVLATKLLRRKPVG